jgi:lipoprotein-releasing system permease protein
LYKLLLILKYLRKRRIAWVSLVAVMLCTTMVLVVISIMGGWLRMFRTQFKNLSGDIVVEARSMTGFAYYEEMLADIRRLPAVKAAAPIVQTYGLININNRMRDMVQVLGYPPEIQEVNSFRDSCHLLGGNIQGILVAADDAAAVLASPDPTQAALEPERVRKLAEAKLVCLLSEGRIYKLAAEGMAEVLKYTRSAGASPRVRIFAYEDKPGHVRIDPGDVIDPFFISDADKVGFKLWPNLPYTPPPGIRGDVSSWGAIVVGSGVIGLNKDAQGQINRPQFMYESYVDLTVLPIAVDSSQIDLTAKKRGIYWIVDDCRTGVSLYDSKNVYVDFNTLQRDLDMDAHDGLPARCNAIQIVLKSGFDAELSRNDIEGLVGRVLQAHKAPDQVRVQTWEKQHEMFIGAVENEKGLLTILFGIISIVAIFLIFCIFYSIVVEKTRDIGTIKAVGATPAGVAGIFLGYGAAIGIVGSLSGLLLAWLIVHNMNEIHAFLGQRLGIVIWKPDVYLFDTIPNTMNPREVVIIMVVAVMSSIVGSLVPAVRAANLNPVEALRWE